MDLRSLSITLDYLNIFDKRQRRNRGGVSCKKEMKRKRMRGREIDGETKRERRRERDGEGGRERHKESAHL